MKKLKGILEAYFETGQEGFVWAFQDEKFIRQNVPRGWCKKCGKWLRNQNNNALVIEKVQNLAESLTGQERPFCPEGQHEEEVSEEYGSEGLHFLQDGDHLTIFNTDNSIAFTGIIISDSEIGKVPHQPNSPHSQPCALGYWIHWTQKDWKPDDWAKLFFHQPPLRAELKKRKKPKRKLK